MTTSSPASIPSRKKGFRLVLLAPRVDECADVVASRQAFPTQGDGTVRRNHDVALNRIAGVDADWERVPAVMMWVLFHRLHDHHEPAAAIDRSYETASKVDA